ncbi:MAG TPA: LytTR family DNA-binding domain-containing protein [Allosphingosinicella sp.]|nr:LytTR family DNA-binding domain-containing protein [Allosphingosinicella sp.]
MARRIAIEMLVVAAVGLALAALGPFGSYSVPFGPRTLFWMGSMLVGYGIVRPMIGVSRWLAEETGIGRFPGQLLALTVAAVPLSLLVQLASTRLGASGATGLPHFYVQVWGIGLAMTLFMDRFFPHRDDAPGSPSSAAPDHDPLDREPPASEAREQVPPRFLSRLPPTVGSPLLCLSMEDHYVRAHGPSGSALILMRMRDAIDELEGVRGLQVHRSWWVAKDAVERVERDGDRLRLRLVNGLVVPVARSQTGAVKAQGWPQP